ncbi:hypothetical protein ACRYCC_20225 [Actinomadura scrupuli]|uniref:hypothetical protein n=1 Tax=Actinomadura scrupuli TaxID=559629 RepID=UPI003D9973C3
MSHDHDPLREAEIRSLLTAATEDLPAGIDLLREVRRADARPRRRVLVPVLSTLGTASVAGAAVLAVTSLTGTPSARAQVAAAAEQTSGQSFRVHIVPVGSAGTLDGVFDPARRTGRMTTSTGVENRYLGDLVYTHVPANAALRPGKSRVMPPGKTWIVYPRQTAFPQDMPAAIGLVKLAPQDPQLALRRLRSATDVHERGAASGPGWTGHRYTFSVRDGGAKGPAGPRAGGSVDVDDQGRVRRLDLTFEDADPGPKAGQAAKAGRPASPMHTIMDFSDYGAQVSVTAPPAAQVVRVELLLGAPKSRIQVTQPPKGR